MSHVIILISVKCQPITHITVSYGKKNSHLMGVVAIGTRVCQAGASDLLGD